MIMTECQNKPSFLQAIMNEHVIQSKYICFCF